MHMVMAAKPAMVVALMALYALGLVATPTSAHPCDTAPLWTMVCDPSTGGQRYFLCGSIIYEYTCPAGLVFNNNIQACDWPYNYVCTASTAETTTGTPGSSGTKVPTATTRPPLSTTTTVTTMAPYPTGTCNETTCQLPECRCMGNDIPGNLILTDVPQMVLLTFDDSINVNNWHYYQDLFPASEQNAIKNPNGCRTAATFFIDNSWTDMTLVQQLFQKGNEMASHSRTHSSPSIWTPQLWDDEMYGMKRDLAEALGVPVTEIKGMRTPFLELGGEVQFSMMQNRGFLYDSSMYGGSLVEVSSAPLWPFTLRYPPTASQIMCDQLQCPLRSYPRVWEVPLIRQYTPAGQPCSMTDSCPLPSNASKEDVINFLRYNFNRSYSRNRAPFMISLHATWFSNVAQSYQGLKEFLAEISQNKDVWQVTVTQMLDWVRNPLPLSRVGEIPSWQC